MGKRNQGREAGVLYRGVLAAFLLACLASPASAADGGSCVWRIEGTPATVYLGGTVHLLRQEDYPLPQAYQQAYERCRRIYFEVDLKQLDSPESRRRIMELSMLPEGTRLQDRISKPLYVSLKALLKERGLSGDHLDRLNPAMMAMTLTSIEATRLGARADLGVEILFDRQARADRKVIAGLETPDFQMRLFDALSAEEQEELLRLTVENIGDTEKDLGDLMRAWKHGDAVTLNEVLNRHFEGHERLTKVILNDRNLAWLPTIEEALRSKSGDSLFLVGVGHLVGEKGVVRLLEQKGYTVTQVKKEE